MSILSPTKPVTPEHRSLYLENLLKQCGYRFNYDELARFYDKATHGKDLKPGTVTWFETMAPFLLLAYQAGAEDSPLTESFPFLEKDE